MCPMHTPCQRKLICLSSQVLVRTNGDAVLIRKRQTLDQVVQNEVAVEP